MSKVGVDVIIETASASPQLGIAGNRYFVAGITQRGSTAAPVRVVSLADARSKLGARVTYGSVDDDLAAFFALGGSEAYVCRAVGPAATKGTKSLSDGVGNTIRLDAANAGDWSAGMTVTVATGLASGTKKITLKVGGVVVESHDNLASPSDIVSAFANSAYAVATDLGRDTLPSNISNSAFSAGADDRSNVTANVLLGALELATADLGPGLVAIPGQAYDTVGEELLAYAKTNRRRALIACASGVDNAGALAAAATLRGSDGDEHGGLFNPWISIPDGSGGARWISPEGAVAGLYSKRFAVDGPGRAPAGDAGLMSPYVLAAQSVLSRQDVDDASDGAVNPIWQVGTAVKLYGWWSLSTEQSNYRWLSDADVVDAIANDGEQVLESYVFDTIDGAGQVFAALAADLRGVLEPLREAGVIYERTVDGELVDPGYAIDVGADVNTPETIAAGEIHAAISVRTSPLAELVTLHISKAAGTATL